MQKQQKKSGGWLKRAFRRYFIDAMSMFALGLFSSLVIGLILSQLSKISFLNWLAPFAETISANSPVVGAAIGVAMAHGLKAKPLVVFSSAATGALGYALGGPVGAYCAAVIGAEIGSLVAGRTPVDIVLVPMATIIAGGIVATFVGPPIHNGMAAIGAFINTATMMSPIPMGIIVSTVMGLALTGPISSAALGISLGLNGIAAGAASVGCSAQMIGFAVASYKDNKLGGLISQGLGTSKLQLGNVMRKPIIWLPPTIVSAILGPVSTAVFGMENNAIGAGMGTSGLVGQFGAWAAMSGEKPAGMILFQIMLMHFLLPALLTLGVSSFFRKRGWIKAGDMKISIN